jgi:leader peptidase (prepilin peptidase)/N-methyltransferase
MSPDLWLIGTLFAALFGACIGSFLNVCIYRIPLDLSVARPRSHCMACQTLIPWYWNIPVLSYFMLGGRCRVCKTPFSFRYALVELLTAFLFVLVCVAYPPANTAPILGFVRLPSLAAVPVMWLFLSGLIIGTFVDFDHYIIPDSVTIGGTLVGLVVSALVPELHGAAVWWGGLKASAIGAALGFGLLEAIAVLGKLAFKKDAMGFGDVKLMAAIGAFLGWQAVLFAIIASSLFGTIVGVALIAMGKRQLGSRLPFGPYLALGAAVWVFWGPRIVAGYLNLLMPSVASL